jgi:hypothetical protein
MNFFCGLDEPLLWILQLIAGLTGASQRPLMNWLVVLILAGGLYALWLIPLARILRRTGRTRWWSILAVIPIASLIGLWVLAFTPWPAFDRPNPTPRQGSSREHREG